MLCTVSGMTLALLMLMFSLTETGTPAQGAPVVTVPARLIEARGSLQRTIERRRRHETV
jgi:hypothetical protein